MTPVSNRPRQRDARLILCPIPSCCTRRHFSPRASHRRSTATRARITSIGTHRHRLATTRDDDGDDKRGNDLDRVRYGSPAHRHARCAVLAAARGITRCVRSRRACRQRIGARKTSIYVGDYDLLYQDSLALKEKLDAAGIENTLHFEPGALHVYPLIPSPEGVRGQASILKEISEIAG